MTIARVSFTVAHEPVPQPRQRHRIAIDKRPDYACRQCSHTWRTAQVSACPKCRATGRGITTLSAPHVATMTAVQALKLGRLYVQNYTPATDDVQRFKSAVQYAAKAAHWGDPFDCPVIVNSVFVFARHKNKFWKTKPMPRYPHITTCDRDNCEKALLDAMTGIIFVDDSRVFSGVAEKWHASGYEQPHVEVSVEALTDV